MNQYQLLPFIFLLFLFFLFKQGLSHHSTSIPSPLINQPMPQFRSLDLFNLKKTYSEKIFQGHWTLLVVWSSWCQHCFIDQMRLLRLKQTNTLQLIGLNYRDEVLKARQKLNKQGNPYRYVLFDPKGTLAIKLGVSGVPESFLVDPHGLIRYKQIGVWNERTWQHYINPFFLSK